jgi:hypothetical protein
VQRYLWIALVLTSCAKSSKEPAPASGGANESKPPPAEPATTATPPAPGSAEALEHARTGASLGVSADTTAFDEPDATGSVNRNRRGGTKGDTAGAPGGPGPAKPMAAGAKIGAVTVDGKPAPDALTQAVVVRGSDVQACYAKAGKPDLKGAVEITFSVMPTGALGHAKVKSTTIKNVSLEACVVGVIQGIKLTKPLGTSETKATVSITFGP